MSKLIKIKFRNSPENIHYSAFPPGWDKYIRLVENQTFFTRTWLYRPDFYWGTPRGRFSQGTETGCDYQGYQYDVHLLHCHSFTFIHFVNGEILCDLTRWLIFCICLSLSWRYSTKQETKPVDWKQFYTDTTLLLLDYVFQSFGNSFQIWG